MNNRYRVKKRLGEGGNSVAYLAIDTISGKKVTIKSYKMGMATKSEAEILRSLSHPSIPQLIEAGPSEIILEYMEGETLDRYLKKNGPLKEKEAVDIAIKLIGILRFLHGRRVPVIYRDIKPSNIVIRKDGEVGLIDFGAARVYDPLLRKDTENLGTVGYAAPEQFGNLGQTNPSTDIYCFGMTLLQMLSMVDPADKNVVYEYKSQGIRGVSKELMEIIDMCTRPDREDRFKSCKQVEKALLTYDGKVKRRRFFQGGRYAATAAVLALFISLAIFYFDKITAYGAADMEKRMPYVMDRLYNARCFIEAEITEFKINGGILK
ncbi:serine/threonine protein kinase [Butyrivibrio proteoclasticus]|uniref:serine/threonine protein kinase n=1 Tax=Butyrivibrio proteoclasticus TaxID=43305 RepID=UPI000478F08F|nr:serine/threonine-protein kinase [Butyrivibrio proteoclasticus]